MMNLQTGREKSQGKNHSYPFKMYSCSSVAVFYSDFCLVMGIWNIISY